MHDHNVWRHAMKERRYGPFPWRSMLAISLLVLLLYPSLPCAQSNSENYRLSAGYLVAGGGQSSSSNANATGSIPLGAADISTSTGYKLYSGVIGASYSEALTATYANPAVMTVDKAPNYLAVSFGGGTGTATGKFYYRLGGRASYDSANMVAGTGDTLGYVVPASVLTVRGLEYYFRVTRGTSSAVVGSPAFPYLLRVLLDNAEALRPTLLTASRYRIIGVPMDVTGANNVTAIFGDDFGTTVDKTQWRLGNYNSVADSVREFPYADPVIAGRAYWLIQKTPKAYGAACITRVPNGSHNNVGTYGIVLDSGWNQIANPWPFAVTWSDLLIDTAGVMVNNKSVAIDDAGWWYNGTAYSNIATSSIPAWDGVFVFAKRNNVGVRFLFREAGSPAFRPLNADPQLIASDNWSINLTLSANGLIDENNSLGVRPEATDGDDVFDMSEPPPAPEASYLAFHLPQGDPRLRTADFRAPFNEGAEWTLYVSPAEGRAVIATGVNDLPDGMNAVIVWDNGMVSTLTEGLRINLPDKVAGGRVVVGTKAYLEGNDAGQPKVYALHQNFPNPFNPRTTIRFATPTPGPIQLIVYNIIGQRVRTIVDSDLPAGDYAFEWNGDDDKGETVASGIYFYRLEAGSFTQSRKMTLLK